VVIQNNIAGNATIGSASTIPPAAAWLDQSWSGHAVLAGNNGFSGGMRIMPGALSFLRQQSRAHGGSGSFVGAITLNGGALSYAGTTNLTETNRH